MTSDWSDKSGYSQIELYPNGQYKSLVPVIESEWRVAGTIVKVRANRPIQFYEDGQVKVCTICDDVIVKAYGVDVAIKHNTDLLFFADGSIQRMTIDRQSNGIFSFSKDWKYQGRSFPPGSVIEFLPGGKVA